MPDFRIKFVSDLIASASATATCDAPADFTSIENINRAFLVPAVFPMSTAGIGRESGTLVNSVANLSATAEITNTDQITFNDGEATQLRNNRCGAWLVEYIGPNGGPNEIIVRAVLTVTIASGSSTADSAAISGITSLTDCVPVIFSRNTHNSAEYRSHLPSVDLVTSGSNTVARIARNDPDGTLTAVIYVVEFTGANWTVQKVDHTFVAAATNEDETISSIGAVTNAITYSVMAPSHPNSPAHNTYFVWPTSATNLRHRLVAKTTAAQTLRTWVISNPLLNVTRYGTINGSNEITASGVSPETVNVTIGAVPDLEQAMVLAYVGSNSTATTSVPALFWLSDLSTASNWRLRRSTSVGDTEYLGQVIDFSGVVSSQLDEIADIVDGSAFTVTGFWGSNPVFTVGGVVQPTTGTPTSTSATCTGTLGTLFYGVNYEFRVRDDEGGLATATASISPASGTAYVNLASPLLAAPSRASSTPTDLAGGDQVRWYGVQGGDVTDVTISSNGLMRVHEDVTAFSLEANDGTGWADDGTQTWQDAVAPTSNPPEFGGSISNLVLTVGVPMTPQDYSSLFSDDGDLTFTSSALPTGLSLSSAGVLSGTPTVAGLYSSITLNATDEDIQSVASNPFDITVQTVNDEVPEFIGPDFGVIEIAISQAYSLDVSTRFAHATDPLTYTLTGTLPLGMSLVGSFITGTPIASEKVEGLQLTASDLDGDAVTSDVFSMEVFVPSGIDIRMLSDGITIEPI